MINLDKAIEQAISNVYAGKLKAGDLDAATWRANVEALWQAVSKATGDPEDGSDLYDLAKALRSNAMVFGAFKNHHNIVDLVEALTDADGNTISFAEFRDQALQIQSDYNITWLEAEYNTALASGQMAVRWQDILDNQDDLPYLRFTTVGDDRVRLSHRKLEGTTRRVDDKFWDEWYPPISWNCRCDVMQVAGGETKVPSDLPDDKEAPQAFRFNSGKTKELFGPEHPYYAGFTEDQRKQIMEAMNTMADKQGLKP